MIIITIQWIAGFLIHLPIYVWPVPIYTLYQMDYYCGIPYEKLRSTIYVEINIHLVPIILLRTIYARLMCFIHHQSPRQLQTQQGKKMQRDFIIIRRILFLVNLLTLPIIQNVVFAIMSVVNPSVAGDYYMYRIQFMGPVIVMFILSIALAIMTPQLKTLIATGTVYLENQVGPIRQTITDQRTQIPMTVNRF